MLINQIDISPEQVDPEVLTAELMSMQPKIIALEEANQQLEEIQNEEDSAHSS